MFLSLGGSRWRTAQVQQQGNAQLHGSSSPGSLAQELSLVREDPLQALASGKYASSQTSSLASPGYSNYTSPEQPVPGSLSGSPKSILSYYVPNAPSLSRELSSDSNVSLPGGEEAMSRDCTVFEPTRRSQALDLAKKLRSSLGSKFADSLRETIKEVVMKHDTNACPSLLQQSLAQQSWEESTTTTTTAEPASHPQAWKSNGIGNHSSSLAFEGLPTLESSLKAERSYAPEHSKRLSWFSQENLSQSAIAELSWGRPAKGVPVSTPSSAVASEFFTAGGHSDLSLNALLKDSGARESWTDGATMSRPRSAVSRRHVFPEATAMGTCRLDSAHHLQQTNPSFRARGESGCKPSLYKKANGVDDPSCFLDMSKGLGKDYESLLELLNSEQSARPRFHAKQAAAKDWREDASASYYGAPFLELPEVGMESSKAVLKRSRDDAYSGGQFSKRQCLLDVPSDDDGAGGKADPIVAGAFEEYLANLTARVPSFEMPGSPLTNLLEDFSRDSIVPIHLP